jgi:endonuclease YncB( thermonuclease family)
VVRLLAFLIPALVAALFLALDTRRSREWLPIPPTIPPLASQTTTPAPLRRPSPAQTPTSVLRGRATVVDADTLDLGGRRVRLFGIDAPEKGQTCERSGTVWACGQEAAVALAALLGDREVRCIEHGVDRHDRLIGLCWVRGSDVSHWLVERGWALAYRRFATDYVEAEEAARLARRGMWAGTFKAPEEWRREHRGGAN